MELQIAGTNMEIKPETNRYIQQKLGKLNKHLPDIIDIKVEISEEKTKSPQAHYLVKASVNSGVGKTIFHGEERAETLFIAIDKVTEVLTRQLEKRKGKLYNRGRGNPMARGKFPKQETPATPRQVVKTKHFIIEPMSQEEAIAEMERLGHNFFLFYDARLGEPRLLYRRNDGNYGIIEPEFK